MRAIPHNAILQQLGFLANVISGLGSAASIDAEVFASMAESSPRLQQSLAHVLAAKRLGSLNTMLAYARLLDNGFWIDRGYHDIQPGNLRGYRMLGRVLAGRRDASNVARVVWKMRDDLIDLYQLTRQTGLDGVRVTGQQRTDLDILHAVRIALIIDSLLLVCRVPRFAESGQYSNAQMLNLALALDFDSVQEIVTEIFSLDAAARLGLTLEEPQSYAEDNTENYRQISEQILRPLAENKELILQISQMISGYYGAHG
jgi:phosphoenolpyruvate carboxylase